MSDETPDPPRKRHALAASPDLAGMPGPSTALRPGHASDQDEKGLCLIWLLILILGPVIWRWLGLGE
jgi:hypothetical protein